MAKSKIRLAKDITDTILKKLEDTLCESVSTDILIENNTSESFVQGRLALENEIESIISKLDALPKNTREGYRK